MLELGGVAQLTPTTLADALAAAEARPLLTPRLLAEARSAVRRLSTMLGQTPDQLPAMPNALRPLLQAILPSTA